MASFSAERPAFFEGQYLGAEDLTAIIDYFRSRSAQHNLGHHVWGIVVGLDLVEQTALDGTLEIYLQPGMAIDGYGRPITILSPTRVEAEQFVGFVSGEVEVWLRYDETEKQGVRKGFEVCSSDDLFSRVNESFAIEVGAKSSVTDRQSGVTVNNATVSDAREAQNAVDPAAPLVCDASIPHQALPVADADRYWLIPLGIVNWIGAGATFQALNDEQLIRSRVKRRYIGSVSETINAANGVIRLRDRFSEFVGGNIGNSCLGIDLQSKDLYRCNGELKSRELVWLEGDTRVTGDIRLFAGRLEFRDKQGRDYLERTVDGATISAITPLLMQRSDNNGRSGSDLQVLLGASDNGRNRLTIGPATVNGSDLCDLAIQPDARVVFQDNGRVGIGTASTPDSTLEAPLTIRGSKQTVVDNEGTPNEVEYDLWRLLNFEDQGGAVQWQVDLWSDQASLSVNETGVQNGRLFLRAGGNVGIGSTEPEAKLDIHSVSTTSNGSTLGNDLWLRVGDGGDGGRVWIEYGEQAAPLLVLSDRDDPPRIQFQQTESEDPEDDNAPAHSSWIGHALGKSPDLAVMGGRLGIGTATPDAQLTVQANGGGMKLYSGQNGGHFWMGFYTDGGPGSTRAGWFGYGSEGASDLTIRNEKANGNIVLLPARNIGIGTTSPNEKLDVRGNIKLGGGSELFALGGVENLRAIVGRINSDGATAQGSGFWITLPRTTNSGRYTINFSAAFAADPVVVATAYNHGDNIISVQNVSASSCQIVTRDVEGPNIGPQDIAFTFIAFGER
jgi:hypothetical protein